jgi:MFS family permease
VSERVGTTVVADAAASGSVTGPPSPIVPEAAATGRLGRVAILRPLALRDFRFLWAGESVSLVGDQFHFVALAWLVLSLTSSGMALSTVLIAASVPRVALLLVGGALSDRLAPRSLMLASNVLRAVVVTAITILIVTGRIELWHLVGLAVIFGAVDALFIPAMNTIVPMLVPVERLPAANGLVQGTAQLAGLAGPAIAGVVVAIVGTAPAFAIDAASFAFAAVMIAAIHGGRRSHPAPPDGDDQAVRGETDDTPAEPTPSLLATIRQGASYAFSDPAIRILILLTAAFNLAFTGPISVGLAWLASHRFEGGSIAFGAMFAGFAGGALIGAILGGSLPAARRQGVLVLSIAGALGLGLASIGLAPSAAVATLILAVMGLGVGYINVVVIAWLQARVDPAMIGRVMSLLMLGSFGLGPLSLAIAGVMVDRSVTSMYVAAGVLVLATAAAGFATGVHRRLDSTPIITEGR